jgi:hypothetical protein
MNESLRRLARLFPSPAAVIRLSRGGWTGDEVLAKFFWRERGGNNLVARGQGSPHVCAADPGPFAFGGRRPAQSTCAICGSSSALMTVCARREVAVAAALPGVGWHLASRRPSVPPIGKLGGAVPSGRQVGGRGGLVPREDGDVVTGPQESELLARERQPPTRSWVRESSSSVPMEDRNEATMSSLERR